MIILTVRRKFCEINNIKKFRSDTDRLRPPGTAKMPKKMPKKSIEPKKPSKPSPHDRAKSAIVISKILEKMYPEPSVPLDHTDPYTLLIAVLLSAQCTDKRVNEITPSLFALASTPHDMILLDIPTIESIVRPCGLGPQKSKAIWGLSKILVEKYQGEVPKDLELLEELPGVGHKTAQVVVAQAFGIPAFPVDTHIHRLAQRWELTSGKNVLRTERDLKKLFAKEIWNDLHIQIILYGREHCSARGCDGTVCKICRKLFPLRKNPVVTKKA
jgi:endonuclease III